MTYEYVIAMERASRCIPKPNIQRVAISDVRALRAPEVGICLLRPIFESNDRLVVDVRADKAPAFLVPHGDQSYAVLQNNFPGRPVLEQLSHVENVPVVRVNRGPPPGLQNGVRVG
jgi:hypothetical protein